MVSVERFLRGAFFFGRRGLFSMVPVASYVRGWYVLHTYVGVYQDCFTELLPQNNGAMSLMTNGAHTLSVDPPCRGDHAGVFFL